MLMVLERLQAVWHRALHRLLHLLVLLLRNPRMLVQLLLEAVQCLVLWVNHHNLMHRLAMQSLDRAVL